MTPTFRYMIIEDTNCWLWLGSLTHGYGRIKVNGVRRMAHVYAYTQKYGLIPDGLELDHLCKTRRCVNPDHLQAVTGRENHRRGKTIKLSVDTAREICILLDKTPLLHKHIAKKYGVSRYTVTDISRGKSWTDVVEEYESGQLDHLIPIVLAKSFISQEEVREP